MSLDLTLLPFDDENYSHTVLKCDRHIELFEFVNRLNALQVPKRFNTYLARGNDGTRYGNTQTTPYGEYLRYTTVRELVKAPSDLIDGRNAAVWAYLRKLDYDTKVALYWH